MENNNKIRCDYCHKVFDKNQMIMNKMCQECSKIITDPIEKICDLINKGLIK